MKTKKPKQVLVWQNAARRDAYFDSFQILSGVSERGLTGYCPGDDLATAQTFNAAQRRNEINDAIRKET